ncbi:MAG: hypothetical protein V1708_06195 [Candidatus Micrarchaeota archaeon]
MLERKHEKKVEIGGLVQGFFSARNTPTVILPTSTVRLYKGWRVHLFQDAMQWAGRRGVPFAFPSKERYAEEHPEYGAERYPAMYQDLLEAAKRAGMQPMPADKAQRVAPKLGLESNEYHIFRKIPPQRA